MATRHSGSSDAENTNEHDDFQNVSVQAVSPSAVTEVGSPTDGGRGRSLRLTGENRSIRGSRRAIYIEGGTSLSDAVSAAINRLFAGRSDKTLIRRAAMMNLGHSRNDHCHERREWRDRLSISIVAGAPDPHDPKPADYPERDTPKTKFIVIEDGWGLDFE